MNQYDVHILDLPNEILYFILTKLNNIDVLYSFLNIGNQRLDNIVQHRIFTDTLNFVSISLSTDEVSSIPTTILDRFYVDILSRLYKNVTSLIVESVTMEYILRAVYYPNLTKLKIFDFNKAIVSCYFMSKIFVRLFLYYTNVDMLLFR